MLAEIPQYTPRTAADPDRPRTTLPALALLAPPRPPRLVRSRFPKPQRPAEGGWVNVKSDYRLSARRSYREGGCGSDVPAGRTFASRIEGQAGVHAQWLVKQAAQQGVSKLIIEIDIPGNAAGGRRIDCQHLCAKLSPYAGYKCYRADSMDCYDVGPVFATLEEARTEVERRRGRLRRGHHLNIVGVDADGHTVDGDPLLAGDVYRYGVKHSSV